MRFLFVRILFAATFLFVSTHTSFAYDVELAESSKCGRYFSSYESAFHVPSNLIRAIAITESGKYVKSANRQLAWPWTINAAGKGYHYKNKREAIRAVREFRAKGIKSIDVGCMQVNLLYHPEAFRNLEQAFEPKYNIGYAASFLREKYLQARNWKAAVGLYHNGNPNINKNYIAQVYAAWRKEDGAAMQIASLERGESYIRISPRLREDAFNNAEVSAITRNVLANFDR